MATIRRRADRNNKYQVLVRHRGFPIRTKFFVKLSDAKQWGKEQEVELDRYHIKYRPNQQITLKAICNRYLKDVTAFKKSAHSERYVLKAFMRRADFIHLNIHQIGAEHFAKYRDKRLTEVQPATLSREFNILQHMLTICQKEWDLDCDNVLTKIRRPRFDNRRNRVLSEEEYNLILENSSALLRNFVELAFETAMRRGELTNIRKEHIHGFVLDIPDSKTGSRTIPLSLLALSILKTMRLPVKTTGYWISRNFRKVVRKLDLPHVTFHDLRHCSISRYSKILNTPELMLLSGHRTMSQVTRYTNLKAKDLVSKINFNEQGKLRRIK